MAPRESIEEVIGTVSEVLREGVSRHPSGRQLAAYHREELSPSEMEALRDHLALCPECSELLLDLGGFEQLGTGAEAQLWTERQPAVWQALQSSLEREAAEPELTPEWVPVRAVLQGGGLPLAMAALLVLVVGIAVWQTFHLIQTRDQLATTAEQLSRAELRIVELGKSATQMGPQLEVPSLDLFPPGYHRAREGETTLTISPQASLYVLQLHVAEVRSEAEHQLRILTSEGVEVWAGSGLRKSPGGMFRVALPRPFLPSGRYRLELYDVGESSTQPLVHYDVAIAYR